MSAFPLILASRSRYRAELLRRLRLPFAQDAADLDETPEPGEAPQALALRLASDKAQCVASRHPEAWVVGSDQVASCEGRLLGKPGTPARAREQLRWLSGREARFLTSVALRSPHGVLRSELDVTRVHLRRLSDSEIERYVAAEPALDCAGSFRCEGLGISLFSAIETQDPTALIGLPLIRLSRLLIEAGWRLP